MKRREFLELSMAAASTFGLQLIPLPVLGLGSDNRKMVVIFLRGAADVLSLFPPLAPTAEGWSLDKHPLGKWRGGENKDAFLFDLIGCDSAHKSLRFSGYKHGFHPGFDVIKDVIYNRQLSVFLHTGSVNPTRSHFDQMDLIESGSSVTKFSVGYLAKAAHFLRGSKLRAGSIAVGSRIPNSLRGEDVVLLQSKDDLGSNYKIGDNTVDGAKLSRKDRLELFHPSLTAKRAINQYEKLEKEILPPWNESLPFSQLCELTAKLTNAAISNPPLISLDHGIWDHHVNGTPTAKTGATYLKIKELTEGLRILYDKCDPETVVVVMSEFGRTVVANSNQGTDHGRGSAMMVMGKKIKMKPELSTKWSLTEFVGNEESSYALKVNIDYREIIGEVLKSHLGVDLSQVFQEDGGFHFDFKTRGII